MMAGDSYFFDTSLAEVERGFIQRSLEQHSNLHAPGLNAKPVEIAARDPANRLVGGLLGATAWRWLIIDMLWVDASHRNKGLGSDLLARAEQTAVTLGCTHARTETFDFLALAFYEQHGYEVYGKLQDFPAGHTEFHLQKNLP